MLELNIEAVLFIKDRPSEKLGGGGGGQALCMFMATKKVIIINAREN